MNNIGENIRKLRKEKDITQEKLAQRLNISVPAISKWERGECLPDVTLIIPIASFFGVTTDELLGVSDEIRKIRITEYTETTELNRKKSNRYEMDYKTSLSENYELLQKLYTDFPDSYDVMQLFLENARFHYGYNWEEQKRGYLENSDTYELICNNIIERSTDDYLRIKAYFYHAWLYKAKGDIERAEKMIKQIPYTDYYFHLSDLLSDTPSGFETMMNYIYQSSCSLFSALYKSIYMINGSYEEKISLFERMLSLFNVIIDKGDEGMYLVQIERIYSGMTYVAIQAGKYDDAIRYLSLRLEITHRQINEIKRHEYKTGFFAGWNGYENYVFEDGKEKLITIISQLEKENLYAPLQERDDFKQLIKKYKIHE